LCQSNSRVSQNQIFFPVSNLTPVAVAVVVPVATVLKVVAVVVATLAPKKRLVFVCVERTIAKSYQYQ